jgi:hypothetical protein
MVKEKREGATLSALPTQKGNDVVNFVAAGRNKDLSVNVHGVGLARFEGGKFSTANSRIVDALRKHPWYGKMFVEVRDGTEEKGNESGSSKSSPVNGKGKEVT